VNAREEIDEREQRVNALLGRYIMRRYKDRDGGDNAHLKSCPESALIEHDAKDTRYGCDTGCEYMRFEAVITCPHDEREEYDWGDFGELEFLISDLEREEARGE
jgi:hypothetical protein